MGAQPNLSLTNLLNGVGWSSYDLARAINKSLGNERRIHPTTPSTWRDKGVVPRGSLPSLVAGLLTEAHGRVVTEQDIWPHLPRSSRVHESSIDGLHVSWTSHESLALLGAVQTPGPSSVRRYFALSGTELVGAAARWDDRVPELLPARKTGTGAVTRELVEYLEREAAALRRLDDGHGGTLVQRTAAHQLTLSIELLRESRYSARDGRALASVVAQIAQLAGWLHFDLDDHGHAQRSYLVALRAAGLAGDRPLGAMILSALAAQQTWRNRPKDALSLLTAATASLPTAAPPRVRAILRMREARAYAMTGNEPQATLALQRAERELERADASASSEPAPVWAYWLNPAVLAGEAGRTLLDLGQAKPAVEHLDSGLGMLGDTASRDRILYGLTLAKAYATSQNTATADLERACYETTRVLPAMSSVSSARCRTLLNDVLATLGPHRIKCVRQLKEQATETLGVRV